MTAEGARRVASASLFLAARALRAGANLAFHAASGLLWVADLERGSQRQWDEFGLAMSDEDIGAGLMEVEERFYPRFLRPGDRILLVGCGTGRDLLALLQRGYLVEGLDVSATCVAVARTAIARRGLDALLHVGAIQTTTIPRPVDVVILSWLLYSVIPRAATRISILRRLATHLDPGGRILLSYVPLRFPTRRWPIGLARTVARISGSDWRPERGDFLELAGTGEAVRHYEHRFLPGDIATEAASAGLTVAFHDGAEATAVLARAGTDVGPMDDAARSRP